MSSLPLLTLDRVHVGPAQQPQLCVDSWVLHRGEHWAVLGPSGSGKTLLAAALYGKVPLSVGNVVYHFLSDEAKQNARYGWFPEGTVLRVGSDELQKVSRAFQSYHQARWQAFESESSATVEALLSRQSVFAQNPYEVLAPTQDEADYPKRLEEAVARFALVTIRTRRAMQLSTGELRRLVLARAALRRPRLLILDDPFAGIDTAMRSRLRQAFDELARDGTQLLLLASKEEELPDCITHCMHLHLGRVRSMEARAQGVAQHTASDHTVASALHVGTPPAKRSAATAPIVELRNVTVSYGSTRIVDRLSLSVHRGERWLLVGPNGSGKSTLLSLVLADHPQAYCNEVFLFGRRRGQGDCIWDVKQRIGSMSSETHAHWPLDMRCADVLTTRSAEGQGQLATERAEAYAHRLGLGALGNRVFGELPFGHQRLLLIARALASEAELLVLDEPCQGLEPATRDRVKQTLDETVAATGATLLYVAHQTDDIPTCITHLIELEAGRVRRAGALVEQPVT